MPGLGIHNGGSVSAQRYLNSFVNSYKCSVVATFKFIVQVTFIGQIFQAVEYSTMLPVFLSVVFQVITCFRGQPQDILVLEATENLARILIFMLATSKPSHVHTAATSHTNQILFVLHFSDLLRIFRGVRQILGGQDFRNLVL